MRITLQKWTIKYTWQKFSVRPLHLRKTNVYVSRRPYLWIDKCICLYCSDHISICNSEYEHFDMKLVCICMIIIVLRLSTSAITQVLGLESQVLGLGLGLEGQVLGLGLGLAVWVLGLVLGLEGWVLGLGLWTWVLVNNTGMEVGPEYIDVSINWVFEFFDLTVRCMLKCYDEFRHKMIFKQNCKWRSQI